MENKKQNLYVNQMKTLLEEDGKVRRTLMQQSQKIEPSQDHLKDMHYYKPGSRSKGKPLFLSRNFGKASCPLILRKSKSS